MKWGIISSQVVAENGGRLDAEFYLNPTGQIDTDIARTEKAIAAAQVRLDDLKGKRKTAMQVFRERVRPHLLKTDGTEPSDENG